jgi:hypothetical protein
MFYKEMLMEAQAKGLTSEKYMWESIDDLEEILCMVKEMAPTAYWKYIRKVHCMIYKGHYDEVFARHDVKHLRYTDKTGVKHEGAHWSAEQVEDATRGFAFPAGTTKWDKWVAANVAYSDLCRKFDDAQILQAMHLMFFADEDFEKSATKIWWYMNCKYNG